MTSQAEKFKIGVFVLVSIVVAVGFVIWLGASRFFEDSRAVVAYFSESVQGLESDSPVKFRGVPVGRVRAIRMAPDGRLIEVVISLTRTFKVTPDLGIKMNLLGLTGQKYLEIDTFPSDQAKEAIALDFQPRYPVLATYPSDIKEFGTALDNIFQKVKTVDAEKLSHHLVNVAAKLDKFLSDGSLEKVSGDASEALREVRDAAKKVNEEVSRAQISKSVPRTMEKVTGFLDEGTQTVRATDRMIRRTDNNLNRLSQKLDQVADNLADFTRMIRQKPSSIIFGPDKEPPPKR